MASGKYRPVIDLSTGIVFPSIRLAADSLRVSVSVIQRIIRGAGKSRILKGHDLVYYAEDEEEQREIVRIRDAAVAAAADSAKADYRRKRVYCAEENKIYRSVNAFCEAVGAARYSATQSLSRGVNVLNGHTFYFVDDNDKPIPFDEEEMKRRREAYRAKHRVEYMRNRNKNRYTTNYYPIICLNDNRYFQNCGNAARFYGIKHNGNIRAGIATRHGVKTPKGDVLYFVRAPREAATYMDICELFEDSQIEREAKQHGQLTKINQRFYTQVESLIEKEKESKEILPVIELKSGRTYPSINSAAKAYDLPSEAIKRAIWMGEPCPRLEGKELYYFCYVSDDERWQDWKESLELKMRIDDMLDERIERIKRQGNK